MSSEENNGQIEFTFWPGGDNPHERRTELSFDIPSDEPDFIGRHIDVIYLDYEKEN